MTLTDTFQVAADDTQAGIFSGGTGVRLEGNAGKSGNGLQLFAQFLDEQLVPFCLFFRYQRVYVHPCGIAQRNHFCGGIQLHGAGTQ